MADDDKTPDTGIDSAIDSPTPSGPTPKETINSRGIASQAAAPDFAESVDRGSVENDLFSMQERDVSRLILTPPKLKIPEFATRLCQHQQFNYTRLMNASRDQGRANEMIAEGQDPGPAKAQLSRKPSSYLLQETQATATMGIYQFHRTVSTNYMRKMLALSYHQNTTLNKMAATATQMGKMVEAKLEAIKLNTAAPESRKASNFGKLREELRTQTIREIATFIRRGTGNYLAPRIQKYITQPLARRTSSFFNNTANLSDIADSTRDYVADLLNRGARATTDKTSGINNSTIRRAAAGGARVLDKTAQAVQNLHLSPNVKKRLDRWGKNFRDILPAESISQMVNSFITDVANQDSGFSTDAEGNEVPLNNATPRQTQSKAASPIQGMLSQSAIVAPKDDCCAKLSEMTGKFQEKNLSYLQEIIRLLGGGKPGKRPRKGDNGPTPPSGPPESPSPSSPIGPKSSPTSGRMHTLTQTIQQHSFKIKNIPSSLSTRIKSHIPTAHAWNNHTSEIASHIPTVDTVAEKLRTTAASHVDSHTWNNSVTGLASHIPTREELSAKAGKLHNHGLHALIRAGERAAADVRIAGFRYKHRDRHGPELSSVLSDIEHDLHHPQNHDRANSYEHLRNQHPPGPSTLTHPDDHHDNKDSKGILALLMGLLGTFGSLGKLLGGGARGLLNLVGGHGAESLLADMTAGAIGKKLGGGLVRNTLKLGKWGARTAWKLGTSPFRRRGMGGVNPSLARKGLGLAGRTAWGFTKFAGRNLWGATRFGGGLLKGVLGTGGGMALRGGLNLLKGGGGVGLAGMGVNMLTDHVTQKGSKANIAGHMAGDAAEVGALGFLIGGPLGAAIGGTLGASYALFQGIAGKDAKIDRNGKIVTKPGQSLTDKLVSAVIPSANASTPNTLPNGQSPTVSPYVSQMNSDDTPASQSFAPPPPPTSPTNGGNLDASGLPDKVDKRSIMDQPAFQAVFKKLPKDLADRVSKSPALQFSIWATATQYGPEKALDYVTKSWSPGEDDRTFVRGMYNMRDTNLNTLSTADRVNAIAQNAQQNIYANNLIDNKQPFSFSEAAKMAGVPDNKLVNASANFKQTSGPLPAGDVHRRAKYAITYLMSKGWSQPQATGIVANLIQESGLNPQVRPGDNGTAYGLAQWHPKRRAAIQKAFGVDSIYKLNFTQQLDAVDWELHNNMASAGARLKQVNNAQEAGSVVSRYYEIPGLTKADKDREATNRGAIAAKLAQDWGELAPDTSGAKAVNDGKSVGQYYADNPVVPTDGTPTGGGGAPSQQSAQDTSSAASAVQATNTASTAPATPTSGGSDSTSSSSGGTSSGGSSVASAAGAAVASNNQSSQGIDALHQTLKQTNAHLSNIANHTGAINANTKTMADTGAASSSNTPNQTTVVNNQSTNIVAHPSNDISTQKSGSRSGVM